MSLQKYTEKRNFTETKEPTASKKSSSKKLRFVVQRHHASHLHYDLRLEMEGVLKSWAVPKGPSLFPKDKRLAMMVEDHPIEYKNFEGEIPKGNYGAGTVFIFDEGYYQSLSKTRKNDESELLNGLESGSLKFSLQGKILKGEFALVRLKNAEQNAWLLIKHADEFSVNKKYDVEEFIPTAIKKAGKDFKKKADSTKPLIIPEEKSLEKSIVYSPMLATLSNHIFDDKDWVFERKLDGYRIIAETGKTTLLSTRNGKDYTNNFLSITKALDKINVDAILDGEIVALDKYGNDDFQTLQHHKNNQDVKLKYFIFDLLSLQKNDLTSLPLSKRKEILKKLIAQYSIDDIIYHSHKEEKGKALLAEAKKLGWEGIIAKKKDDEYYVGKRSESWLKFKFNNTQEAIICGFTKPSGSRKYFGALVLGILDEHEILTYIGNCGSGFKDQDLKEIRDEMDKHIIKSKPLDKKVNQEKTVTWLKPILICEVNFAEWTQDHHLRHPVFKGLRDDKNKEDVVKEKIVESKSLENEINQSEELNFGKKKVKLTNLDKIYWPEEKITKGELIAYYSQIVKYILPYLKDKPLSLNRHPNGINQPSFFQKDVNTDQIPSWAKTAKMQSDSTNKEIDYLICNDEASLLYMVNLGCIEINPWLSNYKKPNTPEFIIIDLDPDTNNFSEVIEVALVVKNIYDEMGIKSFVKTSGSTGIHIYVYIGAVYEFDFVKNFAQFIAQKAHEKLLDLTSLERSPIKRKHKIYIDYLQNRRGQTIAAPYSVRPKVGATVSYPLAWNNLNDDLDMKDYHLKNVPDLIEKRENPWEDIFLQKQDLKAGLIMFKMRKTINL